jgi:hypothetical protein
MFLAYVLCFDSCRCFTSFLFYVLVLVDIFSLFFSYIGSLFHFYVIILADVTIKNHTAEDDFG